jgi:alcohol dehydrogenase
LGARLAIPHGVACGALLWPCTKANIAALLERRPESSALEAYAQAGRILSSLGADVDADDARAALLDRLRELVRELDIPGLAAFGMTSADIGPVVAESAGGSMRTNPVALRDVELATILEEASSW